MEEDEKDDDAHKIVLDEMNSSISSLRIKFEDNEKQVERTSSFVEEINSSIETIWKRIKEHDESLVALLELKSTVTSISMKMDETDNEVSNSVLEDLKTSFAALLKKFDELEKFEEDNYSHIADLHSSISTLKANVTNLSSTIAMSPEMTSLNSSLLESAILLNEVSIAQLRNESIWIERRLREVIKSQKVHEVAISESFFEVGDTLEFLTESLFNQSLNISYLFDLVRSHDVSNASSVDPSLNYCNKSQTQKQQRADILLSDSLLLRILRSASMPPFSSISDEPFPRNFVCHTWADGTSFDGIAAMAVSSAHLTEFITLSDVVKLIDISLAMFAADHGFPLPDYALAQGGAEVISHLTSSSWLNADARIGTSEEAIEELRFASSPYNALQPGGVSEGAGHCWPMAGSTGRLTVRLKTPIHVTAITIDHLPPSVAPVRRIREMDNAKSGDINSQQRSTSALKMFVIYSLSGESEEDEENKILLGSFEFDASNEAPPTQTFPQEKSTVILKKWWRE
jgi:prefoldin subunit 5